MKKKTSTYKNIKNICTAMLRAKDSLALRARYSSSSWETTPKPDLRKKCCCLRILNEMFQKWKLFQPLFHYSIVTKHWGDGARARSVNSGSFTPHLRWCHWNGRKHLLPLFLRQAYNCKCMYPLGNHVKQCVQWPYVKILPPLWNSSQFCWVTLSTVSDQ